MDLEKMFEIALNNPTDKLTCYAIADLLEECGETPRAFAWRWMGWNDKRPLKRVGDRIRVPWAWYLEGEYWDLNHLEEARRAKGWFAHLPSEFFKLMGSDVGVCMRIYDTPHAAVHALYVPLYRLKKFIEKPDGA